MNVQNMNNPSEAKGKQERRKGDKKKKDERWQRWMGHLLEDVQT